MTLLQHKGCRISCGYRTEPCVFCSIIQIEKTEMWCR